MISLKKSISALTVFSLAASMSFNVRAAEIEAGDKMLPIDMTSMYNTGNIYTSVKTELGSAGYAGAFYYDDFINTEKHTWKNAWTDGMKDNVLIHDGVEFNMRVIDHKKYNNQAACVFWNKGSTVYENVDVEDDYYKSIEILVNSDRPTDIEKKIGIKLNYSDGTQAVYEHKLNYFRNAGTSAFSSTCTDSSWKAGAELTGKGYLSHLSVDLDVTKELVSFDIINDKYDFEMNSDNSYKTDDDGNFVTKASSGKNRSKYTHTAAVYAMTLVQNDEIIENAKKEKAKKLYTDIYNAIEALGDVEDLHYSSKDDVDAITAMIEQTKNLGYEANAENVSNYAKYTRALEKLEEVKIHETQDDIKKLIEALGDVEDLTLEDEDALEEIASAIKKAENDDVTIDETTVSNLGTYKAALEKINELKIAKKQQDISDKITALGDIDNLTESDRAKLEEIEEMIEAAEKEGIEISNATIPNYGDYKDAVRKLKSLTPVIVPFDLSDYYNCGDIYSSTSGHNGSAGYAGSFYYPDVIEKEGWEKEWGEGVVDNYITVSDVRFKMRVADVATDSSNCIFKNKPTEDVYTTIDIDDGTYYNIYMLANSDMQTSPAWKKFGVKINYSDGTFDLYDQTNSYFPNCASEIFSAASSGNPASGRGGVKFWKYKTDSSKTVTDIQILNENYDFVTDESGEFKYDAKGQPKVEEYGSSRYDRHHSAAIYAISLEMPYNDYREKVENILSEYEESLSEKIEFSGTKITAITEAGRNIFYEMRDYFDFIGEDDYEANFKNYNEIKTAIPTLKGGSFKETKDIITAQIKFDKDMDDLDGKIVVKAGTEDIKDFIFTQKGDKATVTFTNRFDNTSKYKVIVKKSANSKYGEDFTLGSDQSYTFKTTDSLSMESVSILDDYDDEIKTLSEYDGKNIKVKMKIMNTSSSPKPFFAIICLYAEDGTMVGAIGKSGTVPKGNSSTISETLERNDAAKMKVILLDGTKKMKTVLDTVER